MECGDDDDLFPIVDAAPAPVVGLAQVAQGWTVLVPTTVYKTTESWSGVIGILFPDGSFLVKTSTRVGMEIEAEDEWFEPITLTTVWDTSIPEPVSDTPIGFHDEAQFEPIYQGHSHGLLMEDYTEYLKMRFIGCHLNQSRPRETSTPADWHSTYQQMNSQKQRAAEKRGGGYFN